MPTLRKINQKMFKLFLTRRERIVRWLPTLCLCLLGLLIYSNTFNATFHFDDEQNIINNPAIRNLWNLKAIWGFAPTRFFTYLSLAFNYRLHQLSLSGYHIFNMVIHLGAAVLVSWLALLLLSAPAVKKDAPVAWHAKLISLLAGLIFVAHPIQTQAVTYIIQRTASLAAFFYLLSVCLYLKARLIQINVGAGLHPRPRERTQPLPCINRDCHANYVRNDTTIYYLCSVLAAFAAFFTKETAVTLPFMLLLVEVSFFRDNFTSLPSPLPSGNRGKVSSAFLPLPFWERIKVRGVVKQLAPFFLILLLFLLIIKVTGSAKFSDMRILQESQSGLTTITPAQYLFTQFRVITTYLRLLFFPVNQNLDYDYPIAQTLWQAPVVASLVFLVLLLTAGVLLFRKRRIISFSIFWFFLALAPESSIIPIRDVIFEHRLYLPMVGYSLFLPIALYYLFGNKRWKLVSILLLAIIAGYSVMTHTRNRIWKDEITLWSDVVQKSPNKARSWGNRGRAYSLSGKYAEALADCNQAIRLNPTGGIPYCSRASVYYYMAEYDLAIADYTRAIELRPDFSSAYFNRGFSYEKKGEYDRAISDWSRVVAFNPHDADAYFNRGRIHFQKGEYDQAIVDYSLVIKNDSRFAGVYFNRGNAYRYKKMYLYALSDYTRALRINPLYGEAYNNRAAALIVLGEYERARKDIRRMEELGYPFNPAMRKFLPEPDN